MSYVTGSHNLKVGYSHLWLREAHLNVYIHNHLSYDFVAPGVSFGVNQYATPRLSDQRAHEFAVFAQDQWTIDRLTLNLGVRWDHLNGYIPEQTHPQGRFTDSFTVAAIDGAPNYHDIAPRVGAAYDLFGDGRTAIKGSFGRYVLGIGTNIAQDVNPMESFSVQASRPWNDNLFPFLGLPPGNGDLNPDCDFDNFEANGECGAIRDPNFGTPVIVNRYRDDLLRGWGTRQGQWQTSVAVQHELAEGWTIEVGYYRTKFDGFTVIDNLNVTPDDYGEYCITAPTDPGLGSVSGTQLCNLWTITQAGLDRGEDLLTVPASDFGDKWMDFNGVDFNFSGRLPNGATLAGGLTTGSQTWSECFVVDNPTQNRPGYCQVSEPWGAATQFKINGSYPLPYDTEVSFVYQNIAGIMHEAEYDALADPAERAFAEAMLGRPVAVGEENVQPPPGGHRVLHVVPDHERRGGLADVQHHLHAARAAAQPARPAVHEDHQLRRVPRARLVRHLQHLQRELRLVRGRQLRGQLPAHHADHERPPVQGRRPVRLVGPGGRGLRPPPATRNPPDLFAKHA